MKKYALIMASLLILPVIHGAEASVMAGFSPGGTALELILKFSGSARQSTDVAAYEFTSRPVAQALSAAVARGVKVRLVADEKKSSDRCSLVNQIACAGVDVRLNGMYSIMHDKFLVADGSSLNYTSSAEKEMRKTRWSFRMNPYLRPVRGLNELTYHDRKNNTETYETALFLTAGIVSGICPFILSAYSGGSRTIILQIVVGPLAAIAYRGLAGVIQPEGLALSLCAGLMLITAVLLRINRGKTATA